jgi:hypothetical protein
MEITKYLCEFFFDSFTHWLELWILVATLSTITTIRIKNEK